MEMSKQPSQPMQEEEKEEIVMDTTITEEIAATDLNHHSKSIRLELEKRIKKAKMTQQKDMVKADRLEFDNPQNVSEFSQSIYLNMLISEQDHLIIPHDYLTTVQTEIRDTQRAFCWNGSSMSTESSSSNLKPCMRPNISSTSSFRSTKLKTRSSIF